MKDPSDIRPGQDETISQSEVEKLLAQIGAGDVTDDFGGASLGATSGPGLAQRHIFPQLSFFSPGELRKLRIRHEEYIRSLTARLSVYLRMEVSLQMSKLETQTFQKFLDGLTNPTHLTILRLEPLNGICFLDVPPRLALAIVDRELGGPGNCQEDARDLTQLETRLLSQVIEIIITEWCGSWSDIMDLRPAMVGHESSGRYLQTAPPKLPMLVLGIETRMGDTVEQLQFGFPCQALEPFLPKLNSVAAPAKEPAGAHASRVNLSPLMAELPVTITAEMPRVSMTAGELAALKVGDLVMLSPEMAQRIQVRLGSLPKFVGQFGTCGDRFAVQLVGPARP